MHKRAHFGTGRWVFVVLLLLFEDRQPVPLSQTELPRGDTLVHIKAKTETFAVLAHPPTTHPLAADCPIRLPVLFYSVHRQRQIVDVGWTERRLQCLRFSGFFSLFLFREFRPCVVQRASAAATRFPHTPGATKRHAFIARLAKPRLFV